MWTPTRRPRWSRSTWRSRPPVARSSWAPTSTEPAPDQDTTILGRRLSRFATVGVANTAIDLVLFALLQPGIGTVPATILSTGAGMALSLLANALFAFGAERLTLRAAVQFVGLNAANLWVLQPLVILGLAALARQVVADDYHAVLAAKVASLALSTTVNFVVYDRYIWPRTTVP